MLSLPNYKIQEKIYQGRRSVVYRAMGEKEGRTVILKTLAAAYPLPADVSALEREYEVGKGISAESVVQHLSLVKHGNSCVLVLEDFGGSSLAELLGGEPLDTAEFLDMAMAVARALGDLHARDLIHKDVSPGNVLYNPKTGQVKVCDLGTASFLPREKREYRAPSLIEGTLAYMSPEQTGRMNRAIDYRTDLYSLGATLYEALAGAPPFESSDPMELLHSHVAKAPVPPHQRRAGVPEAVSAIVLTLLSKNAEDRYQSARGLEADLAECARRLRETGRIDAFKLRANDVTQAFRISEKLYGRQEQVATLMAAFDRAADGTRQLVTVGGYSGVGKSVLVREVHKPISERRGYFISGKCDYLNLDTPLSAFTQAFADLARQILTESEERLLGWREKLGKALGQNGQIMVDLVPDLSPVLGPQPEILALPPMEARDRTENVMLSFLLTFSRAEHPLVIFLDDLQWIDPASLRLLTQLASSALSKHLLLIGAYRENEISAAHPLVTAVNDLEQGGVPLTRVSLSPLGKDDVAALLADSLGSDQASVLPLVELVFEKTGGNPFFVTQLLHALHDDGVLAWSAGDKRWTWDVARIRQTAVSANVVDLMVSKIKRYPDATQGLLRLASSMGGTFDLATVSIISSTPHRDAALGLWDAVRDGLLLPLDDRYQYYQWSKEDRDDAPAPADVRYRFAHDRVQEAAYSQIAEDDRQAMSLRVGRLLLEKIPAEQRAERIFDLVNHLNLGSALITSPEERAELARLNLLAGRRAKASTAYDAAVKHLLRGIELLPAGAWGAHYGLMFDLHRELTECEYLAGNMAKAEQIFAVASKEAKTREHVGDIYQLMIRICQTAGKVGEGLRIGQECLRLFDVELPADQARAGAVIGERTAQITKLIDGREIASLIDEPPVRDRDMTICQMVLLETWACALMSGDFLQVILTSLSMIAVSLEHGHSEYSGCGYVAHSAVLAINGDYKNAAAFGSLAMALNEKYRNPLVVPKINNTYCNFIKHSVSHVRTLIPIYRESYQYCLQCGDRWWGSWAVQWIRVVKLIKGDPLHEVYETADVYSGYLRDSGYTPLYQWGLIDQQIVLNLQGKTAGRGSLDEGSFDEAALISGMKGMSFLLGVHWYHMQKAFLAYLYEDFGAALSHWKLADEGKDFIPHSMFYTHYFFYAALILAANYPSGTDEEKAAWLELLNGYLGRMKVWADACPENTAHKYLVIKAEIARITGDHAQVMDLYDEAIESARDGQYIHHEALINELAARFCVATKRSKAAKGYLMDARYLYARWGATSKVEQLAELHPALLAAPDIASAAAPGKGAAVDPSQTAKVDAGTLDLGTVMKAAQALSSEIVLSRLLDRVVRIGMENAGAQRGALLVERAGTLVVEAVAAVEGADAGAEGTIPIEKSERLPQSIIKYVQRTGKTVTLDDAASDAYFKADPCVVKYEIKSVLCLPAGRETGRIGVLYLENNLVKGAFTPERTKVLQLLSTQAAISLENAVLYDTLEQRVETRTRELKEKNDELATTLVELKEAQDRMIVQSRLASLGALTAGIAHELRNPLNFVNNFAELSLDLADEMKGEIERLSGSLDPDAASYVTELSTDMKSNLTKVVDHGNRAARIIGSMLEHSRDRAGDREPTDLNALLAEHVNLAYQGMRSRDQSMDVGIELDLDENIGKVSVVPQEMTRVFINLIDNACYAANAKRKAAGGKGAQARIDVKTRDLGQQIEIRIRDNGTGVPEAIRDKIFNPFFTTKPTGEGTGLGLSISHQIVVQGNGGALTFDTVEDEFTEFVITLPRR